MGDHPLPNPIERYAQQNKLWGQLWGQILYCVRPTFYGCTMTRRIRIAGAERFTVGLPFPP
jgi:hypothetical protein